MVSSKPTVLGIDPGSRLLGVSVFSGDELAFYAVKSIKLPTKEDSLIKVRKILIELLLKYQVEAVALEKIVFVQQRRAFIKIVSEEIKDVFKERKVPVNEYDPTFTRSLLCGFRKPTKRNMSLVLSQKYTELTRYAEVCKLWQVRYYAQLFDAVAVGFVGVAELRKDNQVFVKSVETHNVS